MAAPEFPIGPFIQPEDFSAELKNQYIEHLQAAPDKARQTIAGLNESQLDTKYRNWSIRQIIHHLADSHINCYVRFKWALTEPTPHIKSYDETLWSEVVDAQTAPLESSLVILEGLHARWCDLLRGLDEQQLSKGYFHPEVGHVVKLAEALPYYVWHVDHHLGQIAWLRNQHGWD
jgi:uncharacterized damage-inducible protein DinB